MDQSLFLDPLANKSKNDIFICFPALFSHVQTIVQSIRQGVSAEITYDKLDFMIRKETLVLIGNVIRKSPFLFHDPVLDIDELFWVKPMFDHVCF